MICTWLPLADFKESAQVLYDGELHRQREHALFVLQVLAGQHQHMKFNTTVNSWRGGEIHLVAYGAAMCDEWTSRGYPDKLKERILGYGLEGIETGIWTPEENGHRPWWLDAAGVHMSHKSNLIQRRPSFYRDIWPDVSDQLPMVMPSPRLPVKAVQ